MRYKRRKMLFAPPIEVQDMFPKCMDELCPRKGDCANHESANEWGENFGATPNLRQVVLDSWRCDQAPVERLWGAVLADGTFLKDFMDDSDGDSPNWGDGFAKG